MKKKGLVIAICTGILLSGVVQMLFTIESAYEKTTTLFLKKKMDQTSDGKSYIAGLPPFITDEMIRGALTIQEQEKFPASVCIAQIIGESGFGSYGPYGEDGKGLSKLAYEYKNLFGIKGVGPAGSVNMSSGEETSDGTMVNQVSGFRKYHTYTECIEDRAKILKEVYWDLIEGVSDAKTFARKIGSRWATDHRYGEKLIAHMDNYQLYRLDSMTLNDYECIKKPSPSTGMTQIQKKVKEIAEKNLGTKPCTINYCAQWVSGVYEAAGLPYPTGDGIDFWNRWKDSGSTSMDSIPVGAVVCGSGSGFMGSIYGHVGIYIGDGKVAHNVGSLSIQTLEEWCSWQTATCQGHQGWIGWVWPNHMPLDQL